MIQLSDIEDTLTQQNHFCLIDWLLKRNFLAYTHYEQWRYKKAQALDTEISLDKEQLKHIIDTVNTLSQQLKLEPQAQDYYAWSHTEQGILTASQDARLHRELTQQWMRPQDLPQMDLFMDNTAVVTENKLLEAICARHFDQAQQQVKQLTELNPNHEKLGQYQDLINYGYHMANEQVAIEHSHEELNALEEEVTPLAKAVLQHQARDYLAFAWRRIADALQHQPFNLAQPKLHASYALMQIPDWTAASNSLTHEKDQYQQAVLLQRSALCYEAQHNDHQALLCWCLLMELDEDACEAAIESKQSTMIWRLWQDFWDEAEDGPRAYFPAYLLIQRPGLIHHLNELPSLQSNASTAVIKGIQARLLKQNEIPARKNLQEISPILLRLFMKNATS